MFGRYRSIEEVKQNMEDAGCTKAEIDTFIAAWQSGDLAESMGLLAKKRKRLLQNIHNAQADLYFLESLIADGRV